MSFLRGIYLVARREYLAYVTAWGFWASLLTTPLLLGMIIILPITLRQAEPTRYVAVLAQSQEDAVVVRQAIERPSRDAARDALYDYTARTVSRAAADQMLAAFDASKDLESALSAGLAALERASPTARRTFKPPPIAYEVIFPPAPDLEGLKPYLAGAHRDQPLFAAYVVTGAGEKRRLEYWSMNLTDQGAPQRVRAALAGLMRGDALAAHGLDTGEVQRIRDIDPVFAQYDPRAVKSGAPAAEVTDRDRAPFIVAIGMALLLWSATFGVANMLLTGVLEEKSNKILDALLTSVSPLQILTGKLIGVGGVSMTLFATWALFGSFGLNQAAAMTGSPLVGALAQAALSPSTIFIFLTCFAAGYLMYGAIFLGLGSMCDSLQEAQTLLGPIFFLLIPPVLLVGPAFENPKSPIVVAASWIPPFTPFVMPMRAPAGLTFAEAAGPLLLLAASVAIILIVAARVFHAGVSHQLKVADLFGRRGARKAG